MAESLERTFGRIRLYLPDVASHEEVSLQIYLESVAREAGGLHRKYVQASDMIDNLRSLIKQMREENENLRAENIQLELYAKASEDASF
jgi:hypothetical protein